MNLFPYAALVAVLVTSQLALSKEPAGVPENRPDFIFPALAGSEDADCSGVLESPYDTKHRSWLRDNVSAAICAPLGKRFIPLFYFTSVASARACVQQDTSTLVVRVWNGKNWRPP